MREEPRGHYVYAYLDGDTPFYIGKGSGDRAWQHLYPTYRKKSTPFYQALTSKLQAGWESNILIIKDGLEEHEGCEIEATLIQLVGTLAQGTGPLCNVQTSVAGIQPLVKGNEVTCWGKEFHNLREVAEDPRSCLTYHELESRKRRWHTIGREWNLEEAVSFPIQLPTRRHQDSA